MTFRMRLTTSWVVGAAGLLGIAAGLIALFSARPQFGLVLVAVGACALGFIRPHLAWACALSAAAGLAFASLAIPLAGIATPYASRQGTLIVAIGLVVAFGGAYLGALATRILVPPRSHNGR